MENSTPEQAEIYDLIIIGAGPAGLTAAIYGARAMLKTLVLEKGSGGGQIVMTEKIENYPPFYEDMSGLELMTRWKKHALHAGAQIKRGNVLTLDLAGEIKKITTAKGEEYLAKAVILAPGAQPRKLGAKGEKLFTGRGVSYCATCDGGFFRGMDVACVGSGNSAVEEAVYLTKLVNSVTMIVSHDEGDLSASRHAAEQAFANDKIKWLWNSTIEEIQGEGSVQQLLIKNSKTGVTTPLAVRGLFVFVGYVPNTEFLQGIVPLSKQGYLQVDQGQATAVAGVFGAGDACEKELRQVITAASDGAIAAVSAQKYVEDYDLWQEQVGQAKKPVAILFYETRVPEQIEMSNNLDAWRAELGISLVRRSLPKYRQLAVKLGLLGQAGIVLVTERGTQIVPAPFDKEDLQHLL